jgi:WD40 repeat protein
MVVTTPVDQRHLFGRVRDEIAETPAGVRAGVHQCGSGSDGLHHHIFARSLGSRCSSIPYTTYLAHLKCSIPGQAEGEQNGPGVGSILCDAIGHRTSPVFAMKFATGTSYSNMVAIGDEDGYLSIIRADQDIPNNLCDDTTPHRPVGQWRTHKNAVFDLSWANQDRWMYVASGDTSLSLWDTGYATKIASFYTGYGSIKALSVKPDCHHVFASAGRQGDVYIHDARVKSFSDGWERDIARTKHLPAIRLGGPHSTMQKRNTKFGFQRAAVTSLCFLQGPNSNILTTGGQDGIVKMWDIRYECDPLVAHQPLTDLADSVAQSICDANVNRSIRHISSMSQPALSERSRALTSLSLHPDGTQLLASYIGGQHLIYDVSHPEYGPTQWFGGNLIDSFYVKSTFTPDGTHIVSGSSDNHVYIWSLSDKAGTHPIVLEGHAREVTSVACNPQNPFQIVSAGDDHVVKFWSMHVDQPEEEFQGHDYYQMLQESVQGHASPSDTATWIGPEWCHMDTPAYTPRQVSVSRDSLLRSAPQRNITMSNALKRSPDQVAGKKTCKQITISDMLRRKMRKHTVDDNNNKSQK